MGSARLHEYNAPTNHDRHHILGREREPREGVDDGLTQPEASTTSHHPQNPSGRFVLLNSTSSTPRPFHTHAHLSTPSRSSLPLAMSSISLFRVATRAVRPSGFIRTPQLPRCRVQAPIAVAINRPNFSTTTKRLSGQHEDETYEEFSARFEKEFDSVQDVFELQRNLNNCFAYDLVPSVEVLSAALKAARRVNDFPTAVRVFEGIKAKVETQEQYKQYLESLEGLRQELGVALREELYPEEA
ncbi:cytochrome c oxidase subunit VI [Aspergillus tanneri]|uniref:Cytochrome c oxidase subunit 6, mitochondrial n=2 Tax=Aspergillus tanneri TaxID=1220188 RepID=A0A5M9MDI2_9EURO|nr:Cytochrome c oxidase subunit 5A [Aspergillus tanneri]KAA8642993.1 Cytochrome c oxidase subunit 5A [Aspergillus tanneri]